MQRFYFDLRVNDDIRPDADGIELPDQITARREAVRTIASIAAEEIPHDGPLKVIITVLDQKRAQVFKTNVTFDFEEVEATDNSLGRDTAVNDCLAGEKSNLS